MTSIFTLENINEISEKIDINELYEKKKSRDLRELNIFKKLLTRIHIKIKLTSKKKLNETFIWFLVPEIIIGYPKYDVGTCIAYLMDKLTENKFKVKYYHPNLLFIFWGHYYPEYVRQEIKNKLSIKIDEFGKKIQEDDDDEYDSENKKYLHFDYKEGDKSEQFIQPTQIIKQKEKKDDSKYSNISSYKPTGNLVYNKILNNDFEF